VIALDHINGAAVLEIGLTEIPAPVRAISARSQASLPTAPPT
jgi:hypothetical protein